MRTTTQPAHGGATASAPTPTASGNGTLSISTRPAARCTVDGLTFSTPALHRSLPAGSHRMVCTNTDMHVQIAGNVQITAGQETRILNLELH